MMKKGRLLALSALLIFTCTTMNAQKVIKLWETTPPTSNEITEAEKSERNGNWVTNVSSPELTIYQANKTKSTGMAVVICPGGGYAGLAIQHEGSQFAKWLNGQRITAFVLKYRMPNKHKEVPLDDAQQAIRYIREHANEFGVDTNKVGIAGFSAGGHLAATASTHYTTEGVSTRPDFSILFYPVITMETATHGGSRSNLLGDKPQSEDIQFFSNEKHVNTNTPPAILLLSDDDKSVPTTNSVLYYESLKKNSIPATMYIFPKGGHGWGMNIDFEYHSQMLELLGRWLKSTRIK
ncbi:alpha/beta hydrolase [Bacteroides congonensis]|uniref:alpha/beta hydrolase n=2 Tax=Bacteroides congonensis TaxID=1871006 RepID=UPI0018A10676|nr:alpha/beta hydrolase [Bacteroides congonensis]